LDSPQTCFILPIWFTKVQTSNRLLGNKLPSGDHRANHRIALSRASAFELDQMRSCSTKIFGDTTHLLPLDLFDEQRRRGRGSQENEDSCGGGVTVHENKERARPSRLVNPSVSGDWGHPQPSIRDPFDGSPTSPFGCYSRTGLFWQTRSNYFLSQSSLAIDIHALRLT
jgi:hypothetical protein